MGISEAELSALEHNCENTNWVSPQTGVYLAGQIRALLAENERLREALKPLVALKNEVYMGYNDDCNVYTHISVGAIRRAADALRETEAGK